MRERTRDFLVGVTAILGVAGLGLTLFLFGELQGKDVYRLDLRLDTASGLYKSSPVTLNGVRIGTVKAIAPAKNPIEGVDLSVEVQNGIDVPRSVEVSIERNFVGDSSLALIPRAPAPGQALEFFKPGERLEAKAGGGMMDSITSMLDERLGDLDQALSDFHTLAATWTRVGQSAEALLAPRTPEQVDAAREAGKPEEANIASAVARIDRAVAAIEQWAGDETLRGDAKRFVSKAADVFDQASEAVDAWTKTARTLETRADQVGENLNTATRDFVALSKTLGEAVEEVRVAVGTVNRGEGTLGQLMNNPDLYNSITDAAKRLEKALLEAQLLVEKYRKEGVPIRF